MENEESEKDNVVDLRGNVTNYFHYYHLEGKGGTVYSLIMIEMIIHDINDIEKQLMENISIPPCDDNHSKKTNK